MKFLRAAALFAVVAWAQQEKPKPGSIEGVITDEQGNGHPGIDVNVRTGSATTDGGGRYAIRDLPPGRYDIVAAERPRSRFERSTRAVTVSAGQTTMANFVLPLRGTVSGRALDEFGEPVPGAEVVLLSREFGAGSFRSFRRNVARTNDEGDYRLEYVRPSQAYTLLVQPLDNQRLPAQSDAPTEPRLRRPATVPTYYPGVTEPGDATPIVLRGGEHREGVNVTLRRAPSFCIEGRVTSGTARESMFQIHEADIPFALGPSGGTTGFPKNGIPGPGGRVRICELHPGDYRLTGIEGDVNEPDSLASAIVTIRERDALNVTLQPVPRLKIPVEFAWAAGIPPEKPVDAKLSVFVQSLTRSFGAHASSERVAVGSSGEIGDVHMDDYYHRVTGLTGRLYVKDIVYGTDTVTHAPIRVGSAPAGAPLRVSVGHDGAFVKVRAATREGHRVAGATVAVMPASFANEAEFASLVRTGRADQNGEFAMTRAIAPGKHLIAVLTAPLSDPMTPEDIARLIGLRGKAREVSAEPNGAVDLDLQPMD